MDHLMSGGIKPGLLVSQRQLCDATGSTIGAMREALKRLEAEGIVRLIPQRGVMIREPSETEINDVYAMRGFVEPAAARRYAETGDLTRIAEVREQTLEILERKAKDRHELAQLSRERSRVDDLLHEVILANLGNAVVVELFDRLRIVVQISRVALPPRFLDSLPGLREHLLVIAAIEARDAAEAESLMFWHLEMGRRRSVGID
jgi:DNA-binding GntR family transcriptional regulator